MGSIVPDNQEISSFLVTKISHWRGKYKRIMSVGTHAVTTYNPGTLEVTNQWPYAEIFGIKAVDKFEFTLGIIRKKKRETMRFTCDCRAEFLFEYLRVKASLELPNRDCWKYDAYKHHWSGIRLPVILEVNNYGILQLEPTTKQQLAVYPFYEIEGFSIVDGSSQTVVLKRSGFNRLHIFDVSNPGDFLNKAQESAVAHSAIVIKQLKPFASLNQAALNRLGNYSLDEHLTSLIEFPLHKITHRHPDAVRRLLCLTETCLVERDPDTYRYNFIFNSKDIIYTDPFNLSFRALQHLYFEASLGCLCTCSQFRRSTELCDRISPRRDTKLSRRRTGRFTSYSAGWCPFIGKSRRSCPFGVNQPLFETHTTVAGSR